MKFLVVVKVVGTEQQWKVTIDKDVSDPREYVEDVIDYFNRYEKKPRGKKRKVVDVIPLPIKSKRTKFPKRNKMKPTAIILADLHLRASQPICRTDDFWETQIKKLWWLRDFHTTIGDHIPILCAGDIFHGSNTSPKLVNMTIDCLPNMTSVPGNHDLPAHNYKKLHESGYATLNKAGRVFDKNPYDEINLEFFPYGFELTPHECTNKINIALVHHFVYKGRKPFPGQLTGVKSILKKLKGYQLVITGDNHIPFTYQTDNQLLINPGCFSRQKASEANIKPRIYLWYAKDNSFEIEYIPIEDPKKVISRKHIEQIEYKNEKIELFLNRLNTDMKVNLDFISNMENHLEGNPQIRNITKSKILEAMEK